MKIIKTVSSIVLVSLILWNITIFAVEEDQTENIIQCTEEEGFKLYECEVKNICLNQEFWKSTDKIVNLEKNYNSTPLLEEASSIYKENQNLIYKCWVLSSQEKAFQELVITLTNASDKTGIIKTKIIPKIEVKLDVIKNIKVQNNCISINSGESDKKTLKKIILDQSSLELCTYKYYMKFLDEKEDNSLENLYPKWTKSISAVEMANIIDQSKNKVQNEVDHSMRMYPLAFETYVQYDSFIKIHIILELLKEDYRALRDKLYQTLHPINQVVYKIINAQSK